MSLKDTLKKNLDSETFAKVIDALGDDFNFDVVPRTRLNKVIAQRDEARQLLGNLHNTGVSGNDDDDDEAQGTANSPIQDPPRTVGVPGITQQMLDEAVQAERTAGEQKLREMQLRFATTEKLREAKFIDPQLVLSAGLIDMTKVVTDEATGAITGGLDDQITALAATRPYLVSAGSVATGTGREHTNDGFGAITSRDEFLKLPTDQQIAFKTANPDVFQGFMAQM